LIVAITRHHMARIANVHVISIPHAASCTDVSLEQLRSGPSELDGRAFDWGDRSYIYPQYWTL